MQNKTIEKISKLVGKKFKNKYVVCDEVVSEKTTTGEQKSTVVEPVITATESIEMISIQEQPHEQETVVTLQDTPFAPVGSLDAH